jgi:hypothetical protein
MPSRRDEYYRRKAEECRSHAAAAKHAEVEDSWQKLAAQWERLARGYDATAQQGQQPQTKERV